MEQKSFATSLSREVLKQAKKARPIVDDILNVFRKVDTNLVPSNVVNIIRDIPSNSFIKEGEEILTASGKRIPEWSSEFRSGLDGVFEDTFRDINIDVTGVDLNEFKTINRNSYPDSNILETNLRHDIDRNSMGNEANAVDNLNNNQIDEIANQAPDQNTMSNLWNRVKAAGKITFAVGATIGVGLYLSELIEDGIALNSGCFLVIKTNGNVTYQRILGYDCGNSRGDQLWVEHNLPVVKHPLEEYISKPLCSSGENGCESYCNMDNLPQSANDHIELIPDNMTLLCKTATISDILSDMANDLGTDIGTITGGVVGGITGGIADSLNFNLNWVWIILAIVILIIILSVLLKTRKT